MTVQSQCQTTRSSAAEPPPEPGQAAGGNPLTLSANIRLDAETIRAALSVLPTAVADGEE